MPKYATKLIHKFNVANFCSKKNYYIIDYFVQSPFHPYPI